jgi:general transcription factor 3C polypeptide 3 (transcription factor C subunit 4)
MSNSVSIPNTLPDFSNVIANGIRQRSLADISTHLRWFMQVYQFRSDPYRMYYLGIGTGLANANQFHLQVDQKYLLRQIKAIDGLVLGEKLSGGATIKDIYPDIPSCNPTRQNAILLTLYGHRLAAGESFAPAQSTPPCEWS